MHSNDTQTVEPLSTLLHSLNPKQISATCTGEILIAIATGASGTALVAGNVTTAESLPIDLPKWGASQPHGEIQSLSEQIVTTDGGTVNGDSPSASLSVSTLSTSASDLEGDNHISSVPVSPATSIRQPVGGTAAIQVSYFSPPKPNSAAKMHVMPSPLPNGHFLCPLCPRKFTGHSRARHDSNARSMRRKR